MIEDEEDDDEDIVTCKVVLIGESGVGKTSIIQSYIDKTFDVDLESTGGANFTTKIITIGKQKIKFEIWDTAGQERYRSLANVFYKNASICILVYDITRKVTFDNLKKYWIDEVKNSTSPDICKYIYINFYSNGSCC